MTRIVALLLVIACPAFVTRAAGQSIATFENGQAGGGFTPRNATADITTSPDAPEGSAYLRLTPTDLVAGRSYLRITLPKNVTLTATSTLSAALRAPAATQPVNLRWLALDAAGKPILQHRLSVAPGVHWARVQDSLRTFRWGDSLVGDLDEVRELALRIESNDVAHLDLDDVHLSVHQARDGASDASGTRWLIDLAFPNALPRMAAGDGLLVATDASPEDFPQKDLDALLDQTRRARTFLRRVFADAVRPTDDLGSPIALLIYSTDAEYKAFFDRLGQAWRAEIRPPTTGGYTIQDISASTFRKRLGPRRPVYLHESVHAVVARDLRLHNTGGEPHRALQEGLANYLQICVYPKSIDRGVYVREFARRIDPAGKSFFKPLETLFTQPLSEREYAQLASVIAYLIEKDQPLLRDLTVGLGDGATPDQILARRKLTWRTFEDAWLAWGRERFGGAENKGTTGASFDLPPEFRGFE